MIPGGSLGAHLDEHSKMGIIGSFQVVDDGTGTFWNIRIAGAVRARIRQSDGQWQFAAGVDTFVPM